MASKKTCVLVEICLLVLLTLLDARDLWFKVRWLNASDSFAFSTAEKTLLSPEKLTPTAPLTSTKEDLEARAAGWTSFLQKCESMRAFRGNNFLHTLNANCDIGGNTGSPSQLIVSGNIKVDSMAWAACSLLYSYRRPSICREGIVADFLTRYRLPAPRVTREMMTEVMSPTEAELMGLLDLISTSMPLSKVVCVEGFEYNHEKKEPFKAQIFGCASPNELRSAFVGLYALSFRDLHADKAWLTLDEFVVLGMHFSVRQNAVSTFDIVAQGDQSLALVHTTSVNLSCFGFLFNLMIMLDFALMLLHATGALEVARTIVLRSSRSCRDKDEGPSGTSRGDKSVLSHQTPLTCSLYRSQPIAILTVATQLMAWMLILPNAVVWSWGSSWLSSWHVALTTLRLWSLVLIVFQNAWDALVSLNEKQAYLWVKLTYISSAEMAAIVSVVMYFMRGQLISVVEQKHLYKQQRVMDMSSFAHGVHAVSNAFGEEQDAQLNISRAAGGSARLIYEPLSEVIFWSMLLIATVLTVRYNINCFYEKRSSQQVAPTASASSGKSSELYSRLPIEELLGNPIRAKSIVRSSLSGAEKHVNSGIFLYASQLLEHGVVMEKNRFLHTREGFYGVIPASVRTDGHSSPVLDAYDDGDNDEQQQQAPPSPDAKRRLSLRW